MDAKFGHFPPEKVSESDMVTNAVSPTHGNATLNVDDSTKDVDSVVRSLSFFNEEDMVVS